MKWREIPDFNGRYIISDKGNVYCRKNNREIKPHLMGVPRRNYYQVTLYKEDGSKHTKRIHALMAMAWLWFRYDGSREYVVDHIDNDPHNNDLKNLRIITLAENNRLARK